MSTASHKTANSVEEVIVSQASRRDARGIKERQVLTFWEEWRELTAEKKELEAKFASYRSRCQKEQAAIRKNGDSGKTLATWLSRKQELEDERSAWVARKTEIEARLTSIRGPAMEGRGIDRILEETASPTERLLQMCLFELRAIRQAIESR
jgi:CRISPR/Cas system CMR-associated protein Cmr5 small subunit